MMKYAVIIEKGRSSYAAHVPDLPMILVTGKTLRQTRERARKAIALYVEQARATGQRMPRRKTFAVQL